MRLTDKKGALTRITRKERNLVWKQNAKHRRMALLTIEKRK